VSSETQRLYERAGRTPEASFESDDFNLQPAGKDQDLLHKYQDAYDFAPVGFVSLDRLGRVVQTNLAGAIMLDIQRSQRSLSPFAEFIKPADQSLFVGFHQEVLSGKCRRYCEVTLCATDHRSEMVVRIDATLDDMGEECRLVLIDVTEEKKMAAQELERERQQQELLARQPYMLWFKDQDGRLISANSTLIDDWRHFAQDAALEKVDIQSMPLGFSGQRLQTSHASSDEIRSAVFKSS
jgi:PAS domain-containing protein